MQRVGEEKVASHTKVKLTLSDLAPLACSAAPAGQKGQEAMDSVREAGDTVAIAIKKSVTKRPYTTFVLAVGLGFLFGATWRR